MKIKDYRVAEDSKINLKKWPTKVKSICKSKEDSQKFLEEQVGRLSGLQRMLAADSRYALLVIFQGMDAAGKDGAIKHVLTGINPQGCKVSNFKVPGPDELNHDFLWRANLRLPERGRIGIFNRSHYEDVLVAKVHKEVLDKQNLPDECLGKKLWEGRYRSIIDWENHLSRNGIKVVKIYLHMSKEEQRKRFLERIDNPDKNWKFSRADIEERQYWDDYMAALEDCLSNTSTKEAPWYIVPADDKENARLIISGIILEAMGKMKLCYPKTDMKRREELRNIRKSLEE